MSYYYSTISSRTFDDTLQQVTEELKKKGFGVLTEIEEEAGCGFQKISHPGRLQS